MKNRIIKITKQQLWEAEGETFNYITPSDPYASYNGHTEISVSGNLNDEEEGNPITGDQISNQISPQSYSRYRMYGNLCRNNMREGIDINQDGVDDFYNNADLDVLGDGNKNNDLTRIPDGAQRKLNLLLNEIKKLTPKQQAIILNKFIESFNFSQLPISWKKELMKKISSSQATFNKQIR